MADSNFPIFFVGAAALILLSFTGIGKAMVMGGKIARTISETVGIKGGRIKSKVSIHFLGKRNASGNVVGIEIARSTGLSFNQKLLALDKAEFQALLKLLKEAENSL